jgi:hypothetical protein
VAVAVQQRVVGANGAQTKATTKPSCSRWQSDERDDDEDDDSYWWWQSEAGKPEKWKVPQ